MEFNSKISLNQSGSNFNWNGISKYYLMYCLFSSRRLELLNI